MTLLLTNETVERLLTMELCMEALEYAQRELGQGQAVLGPVYRVLAPVDPARVPADVPGEPVHYSYSSMAAALPGWDVAADRKDSDLTCYVNTPSGSRLARIPASPGGRFCGLILLYRASTGELLAIIHDGFLQKTRVGGLAGVAAKYLARADASVLAVIGAGWQASAQVEAHCRARPIREVRVYSPTPERRTAFAAQMSERVGCEVRAVDSAREAVRGAHIVATATNAIEPVLAGEWLEEGMFLTSVKDVEWDRAAYARCDVLTANRRGPTWQRYAVGGAEAIPEHGKEIWYQWTPEQWESVRLLGEVIAGRAEGRTRPEQVIGFINEGEGLQFAAVGRRLYDLARERGLGQELPTEWFLQDSRYIP